MHNRRNSLALEHSAKCRSSNYCFAALRLKIDRPKIIA
jgi:hypothetical protein